MPLYKNHFKVDFNVIWNFETSRGKYIRGTLQDKGVGKSFLEKTSVTQEIITLIGE